MADKNGNLRQRRDARFSDTPLTGMNTCPFKGPSVAIVPMRYALDRSRYDVDPTLLRPLSAEGRWASQPTLKTRTYTLRQLRDGFVYVYDETAKTLHEYRYRARDAILTRVVWSDAQVGQDQRTNPGDSRSHLLYPRNNLLYIAFSPQQWTWRICEHLRSHADSRALWMQQLDVKEYCRTMSVPHALPLMDLDKNTVADVDVWPVNHDGRFADSAHPSVAEAGPTEHLVPLAADVVWTGTVDDRFSALMIALDDPLAVMEDFGMQLCADQATLQTWQAEHEHKLSIAEIVEQLCGVGSDRSLFPASALKDESTARAYSDAVERYFNELDIEDLARDPQSGLILGLANPPSVEIRGEIIATYGSVPSPALRENWEKRSKWRREVDLKGARSFADTQQKHSNVLRQHIRDTQHDLRAWAEHIGTEPMKLFIDTTNPNTLLYLQSIIADLLEILGQDLFVSQWLVEEELKAKSLFGVARFGFSTALKNSFDDQANALVKGHNDLNAILGRLAEMNSFMGHDDIANKPWMKALSEPVQKTFTALVELTKGAGKDVLEKTLLALLPVDSRLARGKTQNLGTLLRNTVIGHLLLSHPERLQLQLDFEKHYKQWQADLHTLKGNHSHATYQWFYNRGKYSSRDLGRAVARLGQGIQQHLLNLPMLFDYQTNRYGKIIRNAIAQSAAHNGLAGVKWPEQIRVWSEKLGLNAGAITWGVVFANLLNTALIYGDLSKDSGLDEKDWVKLTSAVAYTGNAMMALFVETKWGSIKHLSTEIKGQNVSIIQRSVSYWEHGKAETRAWGSLIRGFGARLVGLGGFGLVATFTEVWDILDDHSTAQSSTDKNFLDVKKFAVLGMAAISAFQFVAGSMAFAGNPVLIAYAMHPLAAVAVLVAGLIYLFATFALNYLKRDAIGQWLSKCSWSSHPEERLPDTVVGHAEEHRAFLEIQLSPTVYVKPTYEMKDRYVHPVGYQKFPVRDGAWVQLYIPAELRGSLLDVNLTASHRPFYVLPVEKLEQSLLAPFVDHGKFMNSALLGTVPDNPWRKNPDETCYRMPPAGESVIWQTWVDLTEEAQYLEMQVWYSPEVLASGEGDRGYRYQLELEKEGVTDKKDTRISSLDTSELQVQTLGGRKNAIAIPVPS